MRMGTLGTGIVAGAAALTLADVKRRNDRRAAVAQARSDAAAVASVERLGHELAACIRRETALHDALAERDAVIAALQAKLAEQDVLLRQLTDIVTARH